MTLLCIDDDPDDVELFQDAVKAIDTNYTCHVAYNGWEALRMLNTVTPDYIFLDINMPVMDGKQTLKTIRADSRFHEIPVVVLSTSENRDEIELCKRLGANRWIVKPNSFEGLVKGLRTVITPKGSVTWVE